MSFPSDLFKQTATYWASSSADKYGDPAYSAPIRLSPNDRKGVRWENKITQIIRSNGDEITSQAMVWSDATAFVVGGYLYLGTSTATNPETVSGAFPVLQVMSVPNVKGQHPIYKALL